MTKRTAMLMAAGVVLALFGGSVALSFGLAGNGAAEAGQRAGRKEPIVRTIERTIRVEKRAKDDRSRTQVITVAAPTPTGQDPSSYDDRYRDDDCYEDWDDSHDDDCYWEEHGSYDDDEWYEHHDDDEWYEHHDDDEWYEHHDDDEWYEHHDSYEEGDDD